MLDQLTVSSRKTMIKAVMVKTVKKSNIRRTDMFLKCIFT